MTDLIERIKAAIDEDEQVANAAIEQVGDGDWEQRGTRIVTESNRDREVADYAIVECIDHIARHDPARMLRQVEGARKILALHQPVAVLNNDGVRVIGHECKACFDSPAPYSEPPYSMTDYPCPTVRALAEMFGVEP